MLSYAAAFYVQQVPNVQRLRWLGLSSIMLACAISIKWASLFALIPLVLIYTFPDFFGWKKKFSSRGRRIYEALLGYGAVLVVLTIVFWKLHFWLSQESGSIWLEHLRIFTYHSGITEAHVYGSPWWTWPFLLLPFPYYLHASEGVISIISGVGNPALWWTTCVLVLVTFLRQLQQRFGNTCVLLLFFVFHLVPFAFIQRPMFLYHALPAFCIILLMALQGVWLMQRRQRNILLTVWFLLCGIVFAFFFPIYNGQPLSSEEYESRRWLPTWYPPAESLEKR